MISSDVIDKLNIRLATYRSEYDVGAQRWAFRCCELAFEALQQGNYGIGAVLIDEEGRCLAQAGNGVFSQGFHSAAHAEMLVLDEFEEKHPKYENRSQLHLLTSLEPCPMCCCRILAAGIGRVSFLAKDKFGGMMLHCDRLPPAWKDLSNLIEISEYSVNPELSVLAQDIASAHMSDLREKLILHIRS